MSPARDGAAVLHSVFDSLSHAVLVADPAGTIVFGNARAAAILCCDATGLPGRPLSSLIYDTRALGTEAPAADHSTSLPLRAGMSRASCRRRTDDAVVPLEIGVSTLEDGASHYLVVSLEDLSARLTLEARLTAAADEHREFQRLVTALAGRFGDVEPTMLSESISDSLQQLGEALQLDHVALWHWEPDSSDVTALYEWRRVPALGAELPAVSALPGLTARVRNHESYRFSTLDDLPDPVDKSSFRELGILSSAIVPLGPSMSEDRMQSALAFSSVSEERSWDPALIERLHLAGGVIGQAVARVQAADALQRALLEVRMLRQRVERIPSRTENRSPYLSTIVAADSPAMKAVLAQVEQVTTTPATVLLLGETGTGKEVLAQTIHDLSPRRHRPMIRVSCAAIPSALIESELFGRERGAYTGALSRQIGRFEAANGSTLFLDEIGELPAEVQVKLLRVLQERVIERLGSTQSMKIDIRIIAATNRDLEKAVEEKTFREDLFYRLNVFPIVVPPLRERHEDIPGLVWAFIDEFSKNFGKTITSISKESMQALQRYSWPGNVRELRNVIERAVIVATSPELVVQPPRPPSRVPQTAMTLSALEIDHIRAVLDSTHWRVRGKGGAAQRLGLKPTTLESRMAKLGIQRKRL